jgi:hypothetical protein
MIASRSGWDLDRGHRAAELVVGMGDVDVLVGVDPDGQLGCDRVCHAGDGRLLSLAGVGVARAPAGRTTLRGVWATGSYQVTFVRLACLRWPQHEPTGQIPGTHGRWISGSDPHHDHHNQIIAVDKWPDAPSATR